MQAEVMAEERISRKRSISLETNRKEKNSLEERSCDLLFSTSMLKQNLVKWLQNHVVT